MNCDRPKITINTKQNLSTRAYLLTQCGVGQRFVLEAYGYGLIVVVNTDGHLFSVVKDDDEATLVVNGAGKVRVVVHLSCRKLRSLHIRALEVHVGKDDVLV